MEAKKSLKFVLVSGALRKRFEIVFARTNDSYKLLAGVIQILPNATTPGLPDFSCCNVPTWGKIYKSATKYIYQMVTKYIKWP
jgi:hypothetical protein